MFPISDIKIPETDNTVELWYVVGIEEHLYPTKIAAEVAVHSTFFHETSEQRYARIGYRRYVREP